jgi:soluble lytic murein transglycosylase-like protein
MHRNFEPLLRRNPAVPLRRGSQGTPVVNVPPPSAAYLRTFRQLLAAPEFTDRFDEIILAQARRHNLDPRLLKAIIAAESEFETNARSPKGARGLMQMMPATAQEMGLSKDDLYDPRANIKAGAAYLHILHRTAWKRFDLDKPRYTETPEWVMQRIIASYNAGPRAMGHTSWRPETRSYVRKVMLFYYSDVTKFRRPSMELAELPALPPGPAAALLP